MPRKTGLSAAKLYELLPGAPNELWQMDVTYIHIPGHGWWYAVTVIDYYSRYLLGPRLTWSYSASEVTAAPQDARAEAERIHGPLNKQPFLVTDTGTSFGTRSQLADALRESEDSETLNTSFVERLNLTLRQSLAYLQRRSPAHARCDRRLEEDLALVQCHYNFVRPHLALKFGTRCKTPAMQAGLADRRLSFRDIFASPCLSRPVAAVLTFPTRAAVPASARSTALLAA